MFPGDYILRLRAFMRVSTTESTQHRYNFFVTVHKSIVSIDFYRSVPLFSPATIVKFVLQMCLLTALISGAALTYYALDDRQGLAAVVPEVFPGMSLKKGILDPGRASAYVPEKAYVLKLLNMVVCVPDAFNELPDAFFVVDTSSAAFKKYFNAQFLFSDTCISIKTKSTSSLRIAYSRLLPDPDTIVFTQQGMHTLLRKNILSMFIWFFIQSGVFTTATICVSIIFLTFAAYFFRIEKREKVGRYFKKACFAVSPVFIGTNLITLSGTHIANMGYLLLMLSVFVMFRGVRADEKAM